MNIIERINELINKLLKENEKLVTRDLLTPGKIRSMSNEEVGELVDYDFLEVNVVYDKKYYNRIKRKIKTDDEDKARNIIRESIIERSERAATKALNDIIDKKNAVIISKKKDIKNNVKRLRDVLTELNKEKVDIQRCIKRISESTIDPRIKDELIEQVNIYSIDKNKKFEKKRKEEERIRLEKAKKEQKKEVVEEKIVEFKLFDINNYDYIKDIIKKYENLFPNSLFQLKIEENFERNDIIEILQLSYSEIDDDLFSMAFVTLLAKIDKMNNSESISLYTNIMEALCKKYLLLCNYNNVASELKKIYQYKLDDDDKIIVNWMRNSLEEAKNKNYSEIEVKNILNNIYEKIHEIKSKKLNESLDSNNEIELKSFILFDYYLDENNNKQTFITTDLDDNNNRSLIDNSIDKSKVKINGYDDFNELIDDLLLYGKPKTTLNSNDKVEKFIRPVYYTNSSYEIINTSSKNTTGMYRIRPKVVSYTRFIDEQIILIPNTNKFNIITKLLESKLNNVKIDKNKTFSIYLNYVNSFKRDDTDAYKIAINRQKRSKLKELLKKEEYSKDELEELSNIIDITLNSYKELENINNNFNFKAIHKITNSIKNDNKSVTKELTLEN